MNQKTHPLIAEFEELFEQFAHHSSCAERLAMFPKFENLVTEIDRLSFNEIQPGEYATRVIECCDRIFGNDRPNDFDEKSEIAQARHLIEEIKEKFSVR